MTRVLLSLLTTSALLPAPTVAQDTPKAARVLDAELLTEVRELIKTGDYDGAIENLDNLIVEARGKTATLRDAYLLLIKTYVFMGNDLRFKPQGREASKLHYDAARARTKECLGIRELRHTRPEPVSEFPQEMIDLFAEVRAEVFGSFRVGSLDPADAVVTLDGDTLGFAPGDSLLGDVDLTVGQHQVAVARDGRRAIVDEITITPGATLVKSYTLPKKRTPTWYATTIGATLGVVGGLVALIAGGASGDSGPGLLPEPPQPPTN